MTPLDRMPPHSVDAEEAVLGSVLLDPDAIYHLGGTLTAHDFYLVKHQWVWAACLALRDRREPIDHLTLLRQLDASGQLAEAGGLAFIQHLVNVVPTAVHVDGYVAIVQRAALRRRMLAEASRLAQRAYDEDGDVLAQLSAARAGLAAIEVPAVNAEPLRAIVARLGSQVEERYHHPLPPGTVTGMACGLTDFDQMMGGLQRKTLLMVAGRPGMGKSSLMLQVGTEIARREQRRVLLFSLEMDKEKLVAMQLSRLLDLPTTDILAGRIPDDLWPAYYAAEAQLAELDMLIDDTSTPSLGYIESILLKAAPVDLVIIDHLGLLAEIQQAPDAQRVNATGRVSRAFKTLAKDHTAAVVALVQLSRACEQRTDKRPVLSDLRDSGNLEQDADDVLMLYRDGYYNPDSDNPNICEVIPRKRRSANPFTKVDLYWNGRTTSFRNLTRREIAL